MKTPRSFKHKTPQPGIYSLIAPDGMFILAATEDLAGEPQRLNKLIRKHKAPPDIQALADRYGSPMLKYEVEAITPDLEEDLAKINNMMRRIGAGAFIFTQTQGE